MVRGGFVESMWPILPPMPVLPSLKARFHEATNHDDERDKTADDQNKLNGVTDLIGRMTNIL